MSDEVASVSFGALGTGAVLAVTDPTVLPVARALLETELARVDLACSRFREDSELVALNAAGGRAVEVSETLAGALAAALQVAAETGGLVDPTVGRAIRLLGYDRDFATLPEDGPRPPQVIVVAGWRAVTFQPARRQVTVPNGVELDLGATAKAWCADRAAQVIESATGVGTLVSLGGDVAVAGRAPEGGWAIRVCDRHDEPMAAGDPVVTIEAGGLATSSTTRRQWQRGSETLHHLVDPSRGRPAESRWRTVSVAAATCLAANAASTAAILLDRAAPDWLGARGLPARLVDHDGRVETTAGWPVEVAA